MLDITKFDFDTRYTDYRENVKPCPFCGERKEIWGMKYKHAAGDRFCVICLGCLATLDRGYWQNVWQPLDAWNNRK